MKKNPKQAPEGQTIVDRLNAVAQRFGDYEVVLDGNYFFVQTSRGSPILKVETYIEKGGMKVLCVEPVSTQMDDTSINYKELSTALLEA